jgi:hypothetical protein
MFVWVARGLWPRRPAGTSGWLSAASNPPPRGPSHEPLLLAVIESRAAHQILFELGSNKICHGVVRSTKPDPGKPVFSSRPRGENEACHGVAEGTAGLFRHFRRQFENHARASPIRSGEVRTARTRRKRADLRPLRDSIPARGAGVCEPEHRRDELPSAREGHERLPPSSGGRARDRAFANQS